MKLISSRHYFDHNATSPLSPAVTKWLAKGDFLYANPSSAHHSGKLLKREIRKVSEYLFNHFYLSDRDYQLVYHSGATEGTNNLIKGLAFDCLKKETPFLFCHSEIDHSCIINQKDELELLGHQSVSIPVDHQGEMDYKALRSKLSNFKGIALLNWTWVNNETGLCQDVEQLKLLKNDFPDLKIHIDGVQAVGKIADWQNIPIPCDAITFSAHKFGALKGIGFTFIKVNLLKTAMIRGGGQQEGLRSGTENTYGILSIKLALEYLHEHFSWQDMCEGRDYFFEHLEKYLMNKGEIVGPGLGSRRNGQTFHFILHGVKAQTAAMAFDMAKIDVSNGSACSSGAVIPNRVLMAQGYSKEDAFCGLRLSFSSFFDRQKAQEAWDLVAPILQRFS